MSLGCMRSLTWRWAMALAALWWTMLLKSAPIASPRQGLAFNSAHAACLAQLLVRMLVTVEYS